MSLTIMFSTYALQGLETKVKGAYSREELAPLAQTNVESLKEYAYFTFAKALPDSRVFYAVKANPAPEVLSLLASLGSCFDTATVAEIEMALAAGATPDRVSYGNTIKKERDIARAYALGIRLFAVDCSAEVEKVARAAPGAKVFCRILYDCAGAEWPLSRKFGCDPEMAVEVLDLAKRLGLEPCGISFHVGSQQRKVKAWDRALSMASSVFRDCAERGINLSMRMNSYLTIGSATSSGSGTTAASASGSVR